jgi:hypothetical protein
MRFQAGPALNRLIKKAVVRLPGALFPAGLFRVVFPAVCLPAVFLFISCVTANLYIPVDIEVEREEFAQAAAVLESKKTTIYREKDMVLYYLDKGMLDHLAGNYRESSVSLEDGERAIEENFAVSVSQEVGMILVNERSREYDGEDYEDVYLNAFNALNYYHQGELDEALVEIRRMNNKLRNLSVKYGAVTSGVQRLALENGVEVPKNYNASVQFDNSALARYLGMLFYRGDGALDDVRIDRDQLMLAFANAPEIYTHPVPSSIDGELAIPAGMARLNVIAFAGKTPVKTETTTRIPLGLNWIKIALPVMTARPSLISSAVVELDSGERFDLELLENLGTVAAATFERKKSVIYARTVVRASIKGISSVVLGVAAEESKKDEDSFLFGLLSLGAQLFAEASEQADLRVSRYFPGKAYVGALNVEPGIYSFTVHFYGGSRIIASHRFENISIEKNALNLVEVVCLK